MTQIEAKQIVMLILGAYPNWKPDDLKITTKIWAEALKDDDYKTISLALSQFMREDASGFAPTIGQLVNKAQWIKTEMGGGKLSEQEAWGYVQKALSNTTYHAGEEYDKLPEDIKRAVGSVTTLRSWGMSDNIEVVYSHFVRQYRTVIEEKKGRMLLSEEVRRVIAETRLKELMG